jgi:predicted transcriptional regulator
MSKKADSRVNLSCTVPMEIKKKMEKIAEWEENTVSRLAARAIKKFVNSQEDLKHPALKDKNK